MYQLLREEAKCTQHEYGEPNTICLVIYINLHIVRERKENNTTYQIESH